MAGYSELSAPRPWLILATEKDFFTLPGARMVYEEARRWFRLYGAEERVGYFVGPGPHGTPLETREEICKWMIRWLKDGKGDLKVQDVPLYSDKDLPVTPTGRRQRISFESEPGIELGATLYLPEAPGRKLAVGLVANEASSAMAQRLAQAGRIVLELQPRDDPSAYDKRPLLGNWRPNARADLIGRNLPAMRAHDILRGVDLLLARPTAPRPLSKPPCTAPSTPTSTMP